MTPLLEPRAVRRKAVWGPKRILTALAIVPAVLLASTPDLLAAGRNNRSNRQQGQSESRQHFRQAPKAKPAQPSSRVKNYKLDDELTTRKRWAPLGKSTVIVTLQPGAQIPADLKQYLRRSVGKLDIINGEVLDLPNYVIQQLESKPEIFRVHHDRPIELLNYRTSVTVGATQARQHYGYKGRGVGVAVIDSGIAEWHDDLTKGNVYASYPLRQPARRQVRGLRRTVQASPTTTTGTGRTSRGSSRATATTRTARRRASRPKRRSSR